jgi:hypothetical protein
VSLSPHDATSPGKRTRPALTTAALLRTDGVSYSSDLRLPPAPSPASRAYQDIHLGLRETQVTVGSLVRPISKLDLSRDDAHSKSLARRSNAVDRPSAVPGDNRDVCQSLLPYRDAVIVECKAIPTA